MRFGRCPCGIGLRAWRTCGGGLSLVGLCGTWCPAVAAYNVGGCWRICECHRPARIVIVARPCRTHDPPGNSRPCVARLTSIWSTGHLRRGAAVACNAYFPDLANRGFQRIRARAGRRTGVPVWLNEPARESSITTHHRRGVAGWKQNV